MTPIDTYDGLKPVVIRMTAEQHARLKDLCGDLGMTMSAYMRQAFVESDTNDMIRAMHAKFCGPVEPGMSEAASDAVQILVKLGQDPQHVSRAVRDFLAQEPHAVTTQIVRELTKNGD